MTEFLALVPPEHDRHVLVPQSFDNEAEALRYAQQELKNWTADSEARGRWDDGIDRIMVVQVIARSEPHWPEQAEVPSRYDLNDLRGVCVWVNEINGPWDTGCGKTVLLYDTPEANQMSYCPYCGKPIRERKP